MVAKADDEKVDIVSGINVGGINEVPCSRLRGIRQKRIRSDSGRIVLDSDRIPCWSTYYAEEM